MHYYLDLSLEEIHGLLPFERDIMIAQYNEQKEKEKREQEKIIGEIKKPGASNLKFR